MQRKTTDQNLSIITDRNSGRRPSLVGTEEYKNSSSDDDVNGQSHPATADKVVNLPSDSFEKIKSKIDSIDAVNTHLRIRKPRKHLDGQHNDQEKSKESDHELIEKHDYRSQFGDIKFLETSTTIFDADYFKESQFFGIYVLFWLATGFFMVSNLVHGYLDSKTLVFYSPVVEILKRDLVKIALTDLAMYLSTYFSYFIQWFCLKGYLHWDTKGWIIQGIYDFFFLLFWSLFSSEYLLDYPWIGRVFLMLHSLVLLMKMHSYAFYNGYLWKISEELKFSEKYLQRIDEGVVVEGTDEAELEKTRTVLANSIKFCKFELSYQASQKFSSDDPNVAHDTEKIEFPNNITLKNYFDFTMFPTVVYTLNFPRTKRIRRSYVLEKVMGVFGIFFLMIIVAQNGMYPLVMKAIESKNLPFGQKTVQYFLVLIDMIPYFLLQYLFTFFIIWEFILNVVAELSRFADRDFYGPWWSCTDWGEFARIWNRPVHKFLLRHVYHSSISTIKLNKILASLFTFILSSLIHELVMFCIFRTLRGYLLLFQMSQLPLMMFSNTKFMRDKKVLGNVICWIGFISGPSIICTLYLFF